MPEHPGPDKSAQEPYEELRPNAPVFAVAPIKARSRLPFIAVAGLTVGVLAFVAGLGVASAGPQRPDRSAGPGVAFASPVPGSADASAAPEASNDLPASRGGTAGPEATAAGPDAAARAPSSSVAPAGSSAFATTFRPEELVAATPGGARCTSGAPREKEVPRTRRDGPRLTFQRSWLIWCPIPESRRQAFLVDLFETFIRVIPADTFGYGAADAGPGDALFPYAQPPLTGTVAVTADAAGKGFAIAVVLEEWRSDEAR
jgi:hypothetical protein